MSQLALPMSEGNRYQPDGYARPRSDSESQPHSRNQQDPDSTLPIERLESIITGVAPTLQITGSWAGLIPKDMAEVPKYWTSTHIAPGAQAAAGKDDGSVEATNQAPEDPLIGEIVNDSYEILSILGRGGMAVVYLAKQISSDRLVAMKSMKISSAEDIMRFGREVRSHSRLQHRNIVEYMEFIATSAGQFFLVMERIKGLNLLDIIRSIGRIDGTENIASIMIQACDALNYAHMSGVIHRDLKTSNIVLVKQGDSDEIIVKILDFGIARVEGEERITFTGKAIGSPMYMSPEQCAAKQLGPRSDIYSLGIVAYEMFTGKPPYCRGSVRDIMSAHCTPTITPQPMSHIVPHIPGIKMLDQIVLKALETDPARRWLTAAQMGEAFAYWLDSVRNGSQIDSLPREMLTDKSVATAEIEDKDFMLSVKERDQIRHINRTSSMLSSFGPGKLAAVDQERLQKSEQEGTLIMRNALIKRETEKAVKLAALAGTLLVSLVAYFTFNFGRIAGMISPPPKEVEPPQVVSAHPVIKATNKEAPKKPKKKTRSRRNRSAQN